MRAHLIIPSLLLASLFLVAPLVGQVTSPIQPDRLGFTPRDDAERRHIAELYRRAGRQPPADCWGPTGAVGRPQETSIPDAIIKSARAVGRVKSGDNLGSGTHIGGGLIATAAHVISTGPHSYRAHSGRLYNCNVVASDRPWDMALLEVQGECNEPFVDVSQRNPARGDTVYIAGYGGTSRLAVAQGTCIAYRENRSGNSPRDWIEIGSATARGGDSGGAILHSSGYVGPLWGAIPGQTVGTSTGRFCLFARPWFPRLHKWKRERWARIWGSSPHYPTQLPPGVDPRGPTPVPDNPRPIQRPTPGDGTPDPLREPGPEGPQGPPGKDGAQGPQGEPGKVSQEHLKEVVDTLWARMKTDPKFKGSDGEKGADGKVTEEQLQGLINTLWNRMKSDPDFRGEDGEDGSDGSDGVVGDDHLKNITDDLWDRMKSDPKFKGEKGDTPTGKVVMHFMTDQNGDGVITDANGKVVYKIPPGIKVGEITVLEASLGEPLRILTGGEIISRGR